MLRDDEGRAKKGSTPKVYREWAPVAWADLLRETPDEPAAAEIDLSAEQDFRRRLAAVLTRIVTLGVSGKRKDQDPGKDNESREARSILHWSKRFAKAGNWAQVRSYFVWCRLDEHGMLSIAFRPELLGQLGLRDLEEMGYERLAELCQRYEIGSRCRAGRGGQRAIELDTGWIHELTEAPIVQTEGDR